MTGTCRRCPCASLALPGPPRSSSLAGDVRDHDFRMVVLAGSPGRLPAAAGDPTTDLDWQAAITGLADAVLERGGILVAPANIEPVNLLAQAGQPHARPHPVETLHSRAPVEAVETGGPSVASRTLLAPFAHRNALSYLNRDRQPIPPAELPPPTLDDGWLLTDAAHHPFHPVLMDDAVGVAVIHPDPRMTDELTLLHEMNPPRLAVIGSPDIPGAPGGWLREHDQLRPLREEFLDPEHWAGGPLPYDFLLELLLDDWLR